MRERGLPATKTKLLAIVLWAGTSALSFLEILTVREIVLRIYAHFAATGGFYGRDYWGGHALSVGTSIAMGIVCVGVIMAGGEYHYKHFGEPQSWRLFAWTIAAELSILILALFI
jgi:hypothetical protein